MSEGMPLAPDRLLEIAEAIQAKLPDHCAFAIVITPLARTGEERGPCAYASNGNAQDATMAMMDVAYILNENA